MDVINAKNDFALESSVSQLRGSVFYKIKEIRKKIIHEIAFIESALDDPESLQIQILKIFWLTIVLKMR